MPPATTLPPLVHGLLIATAIVWCILEFRQSTNRRPDARTVAGGRAFPVRLGAVAGVVLAALSRRFAPGAAIGSATLVAWIGLVFLWAGVGLRFWAFHTLGRYFTFVVQTSADQPVISDGPYRFVRHPGYTGILVAVAGIGLILDNWLSLVTLVAAVLCGLVLRIRVEERALLAALGDRYADFAAGRKRLFPYVW